MQTAWIPMSLGGMSSWRRIMWQGEKRGEQWLICQLCHSGNTATNQQTAPFSRRQLPDWLCLQEGYVRLPAVLIHPPLVLKSSILPHSAAHLRFFSFNLIPNSLQAVHVCEHVKKKCIHLSLMIQLNKKLLKSQMKNASNRGKESLKYIVKASCIKENNFSGRNKQISRIIWLYVHFPKVSCFIRLKKYALNIKDSFLSVCWACVLVSVTWEALKVQVNTYSITTY